MNRGQKGTVIILLAPVIYFAVLGFIAWGVFWDYRTDFSPHEWNGFITTMVFVGILSVIGTLIAYAKR